MEPILEKVYMGGFITLDKTNKMSLTGSLIFNGERIIMEILEFYQKYVS